MDCTDISTLELLKSYDAILEELRKRDIVRTSNPPAGGYAEYLAAKALGLDLENNSNAGYDAKDKLGKGHGLGLAAFQDGLDDIRGKLGHADSLCDIAVIQLFFGSQLLNGYVRVFV